MNRILAAACAATLLTGTLTACSSRTMHTYPNGTNTTPSGTSYTAPSSRTNPAGADEDRASYNRMTSNRTQYDGTNSGRYTAYSDGTVSPGSNNSTYAGNGTGRGLTGAARDLTGGVGNAVRDVTNGVGNAVRDIGTGVTNRDSRTY